ncbi:DUF5683 domain-containing protein [Duncaniella muris]|jgi:hypothetical protein|uniref:DUF5683 domain-containing protein n=2 Tax=Duncaniella muris TaxID=2094150 RepID=UPI000ADF18B5|nr:DUF5683 domain-containing protein [Duncaniella muris]NBI19650.1 hypothetical protein [Muribaculaceae bacterium Z1]GFI52840.1 hypothetical protein IMSAGC021_01148 [Muribaculaceae bacterium]
MQFEAEKEQRTAGTIWRVAVGMMLIVLTCPFNIFSENMPAESCVADADSVAPVVTAPSRKPVRPERRHTSPISNLPDSFPVGNPQTPPVMVVLDSLSAQGDSVSIVPLDSVPVVASPLIAVTDSIARAPEEKKFTFVPDPTKAVWMSALFPGLGQLYNRRYWKLPIVVGGFMGLGYAMNWNNTMLRDYTRAYSDIMDNDPSTKSYMDFFAPTVQESDLNKEWLTNILRQRKNMYRRQRDLCVICMIGVYLVAMVDAYVDAQLAHFDISPDLSVDIAPALLPTETRKNGLPGLGVCWAVNF